MTVSSRWLFLPLLGLWALACGPQTTEFASDAGEPDASVEGVDAGPTGKTLKVTYGAESKEIFLSQAEAVDKNGVVYSRVGDVVLLAVPGKALDQLVATNFIGADGFNSASKGNCQPLLPLAGPTLAKGFVDRETRNLAWDESLQFPGCMSPRDLAEVVVADKP